MERDRTIYVVTLGQEVQDARPWFAVLRQRAFVEDWQARDKVIEWVDASFGFSVEFSNQPKAHRALYDLAMPYEDGSVDLDDGTTVKVDLRPRRWLIEQLLINFDELPNADWPWTTERIVRAFNAKRERLER